jgi:hypothetical protein
MKKMSNLKPPPVHLRKSVFVAGIAFALSSGLASGAEVKVFNAPIPTKLESQAIACKQPESLYLIYEGGMIAMAGGGKDAFKSYFDAAARVFEAKGECLFNSTPMDVQITGVSILTSPVKQQSSRVIYGQFTHPTQNVAMFAMLESLPGLEAEIDKPAGDSKPESEVAK